MPRFADVYVSDKIRGWPCISVPRFSTAITQADSGAEQANRRWQHPLYTYRLPEAIRNHGDFESIRDHWLVMGGPAKTWPWRDPLDFASRALFLPNKSDAVVATDQVIGTGNGIANSFQLTKRYVRGAVTYDRPILLPVVSSVLVAIDGAPPISLGLTWLVSRPGGVLTFSAPVPNGAVITAGYLFDVEVRFERDDSFEGIAKAYAASGFSDLDLISVRSC
jgi:uncharacterized protein (TIGR02217 family)